MKRIAAVLAALAALFMLSGPPAVAQPSSALSVRLVTTPGYHYATFHSCTVDGRQALMTIGYRIDSGTDDWRLEEVEYSTTHNGHPAFEANAVRIDLETTQGLYTEASPAWGGSSTTLNDMPTYHQVFYGSSQIWLSYANVGPVWMRARSYGVGAGSATGRCDDDAQVA